MNAETTQTTKKVKEKYTMETIDNLITVLKALPKADKKRIEVGKTEAVGLMAKEIKSLQERGYSMKMIAEILRANRFEITENVLKSYITRTSKVPKTKPKVVNQETQEEQDRSNDGGTPALKKPITVISDVD
jgi:hypothetical protein